jgi:hypothetical protein
MTEKDSGLAGRMDDFAFEVVSEPREEGVAISQEEWNNIQKQQADAILVELGM